jgi:hypothetical protein
VDQLDEFFLRTCHDSSKQKTDVLSDRLMSIQVVSRILRYRDAPGYCAMDCGRFDCEDVQAIVAKLDRVP